MAKKRKMTTSIGERIEKRLQQWCGRIPPGKRITIILSLLSLFTGLSLYVTFSSLFNFGKDEKQKLIFKHIKGLQLELLKDKRNKPDSLKTTNEFYYERKRK